MLEIGVRWMDYSAGLVAGLRPLGELERNYTENVYRKKIKSDLIWSRGIGKSFMILRNW